MEDSYQSHANTIAGLRRSIQTCETDIQHVSVECEKIASQASEVDRKIKEYLINKVNG